MSNVPLQIVKSNSLVTEIAPTTEGTTLIVAFADYYGDPAAIGSIKLGSYSLNYGGEVNGNYTCATFYLDDIPAGETVVTFTVQEYHSFDISAGHGGVCIYEVPNLVASGSYDRQDDNAGTSTDWTSLATGTFSQAVEFLVGIAIAPGGDSIEGTSDWVNTSDIYGVWISGYKIVTDQSTQVYSGVQSASGDWLCLVNMFKSADPAPNPHAAAFFAFFP